MQPGDRLVCTLIEDLPAGQEFKDWPPHITIVPWFRLSISSNELAKKLKDSYIGAAPFKVDVGGEMHLGYKRRKTVNLLSAPMLLRLEGQTRRLLHSYKAWVVDEADKTRRQFRPHVTILTTGRVREGDSFILKRLYIISQHGNFKRVDQVITL